jgi:hypothetical protein
METYSCSTLGISFGVPVNSFQEAKISVLLPSPGRGSHQTGRRASDERWERQLREDAGRYVPCRPEAAASPSAAGTSEVAVALWGLASRLQVEVSHSEH